jgi:hypothetical protein
MFFEFYLNNRKPLIEIMILGTHTAKSSGFSMCHNKKALANARKSILRTLMVFCLQSTRNIGLMIASTVLHFHLAIS